MNQELTFTSPAKTPYTFSIRIIEGQTGNIGYLIKVSAKDAVSGAEKIGTYQIHNAEHESYLSVFEKLSADFKLRLPQNKNEAVPPDSQINYQEVLLENQDKGMLYGYGDPAVIRTVFQDKTFYYLLSTSNDAPDSFPILRSENLKDWAFIGYVFPKDNKPAWAADGELISDYWAPEMHQVGGEYRVYFVARDKHTRELCIGMARSSSPEGPFTAATEPVLKGNVIDPHLYIQNTDTAYLFWKEDNNDVWPGALIKLLYNHPLLIKQLFFTHQDQMTASFMVTLWPWLQQQEPMQRFLFVQVFIESVIDRFTEVYNLLSDLCKTQPPDISEEITAVRKFMKTPMFARQLSADGTCLVGERTKTLENDLEWEAHLVEGMWVTQQQGKYYLFYAGNDFSTHQYGIGVAIADAPLGPYHKMAKPFLQSTTKWLAPGHPSVTTAPNGEPLMFLHAYFPGQAGYKKFRALLSVQLRFKPDGVYWQ